MLVKLLKISEENTLKDSRLNKKFILKEIFLNNNSIICIEEDEYFKTIYPKDNDTEQEFTRLKLNIGNLGEEIIVVGNYSLIAKKIGAKNAN
jgi:hypothetical protein